MAEQEHRWPCESCGADLRFSPGDTALKCDHCGHVQALPDAPPARHSALEELDLNRALQNDIVGQVMRRLAAIRPDQLVAPAEPALPRSSVSAASGATR